MAIPEDRVCLPSKPVLLAQNKTRYHLITFMMIVHFSSSHYEKYPQGRLPTWRRTEHHDVSGAVLHLRGAQDPAGQRHHGRPRSARPNLARRPRCHLDHSLLLSQGRRGGPGQGGESSLANSIYITGFRLKIKLHLHLGCLLHSHLPLPGSSHSSCQRIHASWL